VGNITVPPPDRGGGQYPVFSLFMPVVSYLGPLAPTLRVFAVGLYGFIREFL